MVPPLRDHPPDGIDFGGDSLGNFVEAHKRLSAPSLSSEASLPRNVPPSPSNSSQISSNVSVFSGISERFHGVLYFPDDESEAPSSIIGASKRHAERRLLALQKRERMRERRIDSIEKTSRRKRERHMRNLGKQIVESELRRSEARKAREARQARVRDVLAEQLKESTLDALNSCHGRDVEMMRRVARLKIDKMETTHSTWSSREAKQAKTMKRLAARHNTRCTKQWIELDRMISG